MICYLSCSLLLSRVCVDIIKHHAAQVLKTKQPTGGGVNQMMRFKHLLDGINNAAL